MLGRTFFRYPDYERFEIHYFEYHWPGDQILADRGFTLNENFALNSGTELLIPAFTRRKNNCQQLKWKEQGR